MGIRIRALWTGPQCRFRVVRIEPAQLARFVSSSSLSHPYRVLCFFLPQYLYFLCSRHESIEPAVAAVPLPPAAGKLCFYQLLVFLTTCVHTYIVSTSPPPTVPSSAGLTFNQIFYLIKLTHLYLKIVATNNANSDDDDVAAQRSKSPMKKKKKNKGKQNQQQTAVTISLKFVLRSKFIHCFDLG